MRITKVDLNSSPSELNDFAQSVAKAIAKDVKTHQLRNIFSAIEKMRTLFKRRTRSLWKLEFKELDLMDKQLENQLILLKPKIAYAAGRQKKIKETFFDLVDKAVDAVDQVLQENIVLASDDEEEKKKKEEEKRKAYERFFQLMESVVAYHKFFEK